jgi:hypothetical protein
LPEVKEILTEFEASMIKKIKENLGVDIRGDTMVYQKPYPSHFDWAPSPANFHLPNFIKFSGEDNRSTREHVSQYLAQLGEASSSEALAVRMFPLSLIGTTFFMVCFIGSSSINSWYDLEKKFHEHFFSGSNELKLYHLTSVKQPRDESVVDYFRRFRDTKNRCFNVFIAKKDLADLAYNGLHSYFKEKLDGFDFFTVNQVM